MGFRFLQIVEVLCWIVMLWCLCLRQIACVIRFVICFGLSCWCGFVVFGIFCWCILLGCLLRCVFDFWMLWVVLMLGGWVWVCGIYWWCVLDLF